MKKVIVALAGLIFLLSVPSVRAQDDDSSSAQPSAQVDIDSSGDTTVTTDNGAGVTTESSGNDPVEVDDANGDAAGTVTVESGDGGDSN